MADTSTAHRLARLEVHVEVSLDRADEEAVRWAVERAAERAALDCGADVLRVTVTADPWQVERCFGDGDPLYERYHDEEWGFPVTGERELFERLVLESFQSGLAWITILRKREAFRSAFAGFDIDAVAAFGPDDVERLLHDAGIVRNRAKIEAAIANACATIALHASGGTLREVLWTDAEPAAVAKQLKALGFRFLGPVTVESAMQACGVVNGHPDTCPGWARIEALTRGAPGRI